MQEKRAFKSYSFLLKKKISGLIEGFLYTLYFGRNVGNSECISLKGFPWNSIFLFS